MVWPYIVLALGSIVGYELVKSWLESQTQPQQQMYVSPALIVALVIMAMLIMSR